jgi:ubiquinone/menaquinone biosynthesis C-methylase UbiE
MSDAQPWDNAYAGGTGGTLWGETPVPYVVESLECLRAINGPVLEIPCGDGRNTLMLAQACDELVAADVSTRALSLASDNLIGQGVSNVRFVQADVLELQFPDGSFSAAVCWGLLHHVRRPELVLAELVRICRSGAVIIANALSVGDSTRGDDMVPIGEREYMYRESLYFHYYTERDITDLVKTIRGSRVIELRMTKWVEPPHRGYREYEHEHESWGIVMVVG